MRRLCLVLVVVLGCGVSPILSDALPVMASDAGKPTVAGWVEYGWIGEPPVRFKVKLDTGAKNSSINAPSYREFKKDGATFIAFKLVNELGQSLAVEEPIVRVATIRRAGVGSRQRPVIMLKTCVAGVTSDVEFTIADRSDMTYPVLIGRTFLADAILVHSDRSFLKTGSCTN